VSPGLAAGSFSASKSVSRRGGKTASLLLLKALEAEPGAGWLPGAGEGAKGVPPALDPAALWSWAHTFWFCLPALCPSAPEAQTLFGAVSGEQSRGRFCFNTLKGEMQKM